MKNAVNQKDVVMKRYVCILLLSILFALQSNGQSTEKKPLNPSVFDEWKSLENPIISDNGEWVSFEINPQKGDGCLFLTNLNTQKRDSVPRGYHAQFSPESDFLVFKIKTPEDSTRKAKLAKKKEDQLPKDSLGRISVILRYHI